MTAYCVPSTGSPGVQTDFTALPNLHGPGKVSVSTGCCPSCAGIAASPVIRVEQRGNSLGFCTMRCYKRWCAASTQ